MEEVIFILFFYNEPGKRFVEFSVISTPAHQDSGFLTLLQTFGFPGLEIQMEDGSWRGVNAKKNTLVVNLGEQMTDVRQQAKFKLFNHTMVQLLPDVERPIQSHRP